MSESRSLELAPSEVRSDELGLTQFAGLTGGGIAVLGVIIVIANQLSPRILTSNYGYFFTALGLAVMLYHALRDSTIEVRRGYLYFSVGLLFLAVVASVIPGPVFSSGSAKSAGYHFLPWTPLLGVLGLVFLSTALRHETNPKFLLYGLTILTSVGTLLCLGSVVFAIFLPSTLLGPGILLGLVGLGFFIAFLTHVDASYGLGELVATLLGLLGAVAIVYALGRSIFPQLLYDGPQGLKNAYQAYDTWLVAGRLGIIAACGALAYWIGTNRALPPLLRIGVAILAGCCAAVFIYASFVTSAIATPKPYLVPTGLLLALLGALFLTVSIGLVSDGQLVTLTRRELGSTFHSPIAYFVLFGMTCVLLLGYWLFLGVLAERVRRGGGFTPEPILRDYLPISYFGPILAFILVPLLTMRLFSDEKRTNTMEMLLTIPVNEWSIVLSKFFGCWVTYLLVWLPSGVYLLALRMVGGEPFDYKPMLSAYGAIAVSGLGFIAMGTFFSSLTKNQIIAAMLTFGGMLLLYLLQFADYFDTTGSPFLKQVISGVSVAAYARTWDQALEGQLPVRDLLLYCSMAVFWLFLTTKVLEARKWG